MTQTARPVAYFFTMNEENDLKQAGWEWQAFNRYPAIHYGARKLVGSRLFELLPQGRTNILRITDGSDTSEREATALEAIKIAG